MFITKLTNDILRLHHCVQSFVKHLFYLKIMATVGVHAFYKLTRVYASNLSRR